MWEPQALGFLGSVPVDCPQASLTFLTLFLISFLPVGPQPNESVLTRDRNKHTDTRR